MNRYPYWGFPYSNPYYRYNYYNHNKSNKKEKFIDNKSENSQKKDTTNHFGFSNIFSSFDSFDKDEPIFEIFGIQLFLDDIIILGLLFFLYQEQVDDEILYIVLFLLLFG